MIFRTLHLAYRGKNLPIGRTSYRKVLTKGRSQRSPEILIPPYIAIGELRLMLNTDYVSCFRTAKVSISRNKYKWNDAFGRVFENLNKRNVVVPFDTAAFLSKQLGFKPVKINPEPDLEAVPSSKDAIPVIAVIGHNEHGKTTLIERLTGVDPRGMDQAVKTQHLAAVTVTHPDQFSATFLDTPGDFIFDVIRGRAIHLSDLALVVVSAEGPELRTRDVILQADRFDVPVVFCVNKTDLEYCNVDLVKSELILECNLMYESGQISRDFRREIENLVPVSALKGENLSELVAEIRRNVPPKLPFNPARMEHFGGEDIKRYEKYIRRPNCLVSTGDPPRGVGFILEVTKSQSFGIVLTVIVRAGSFVEGNYFVAGTAFGRISGIYAAKESIEAKEKLESVRVGMSVCVTGLKDLDRTSVDDFILVMPQHEAFRLSQYRKLIQVLKSSQVEGPPLETPWAVSLKPNEPGYQGEEAEARAMEGDKSDPNCLALSEITEEDPKDTNLNSDNLQDHLTSIYLKPVEDDGWSTASREHNEKLNERWRNKFSSHKWVESVGKSQLPDQTQLDADKLATGAVGKPVVPVILRANFLGTFDSLLDGFELLEKEYDVRIPLIHGGIGPIVPNDIVQAEIGNKFTFCPVYAFQVPVHNDAAKHAIINKVVVKRFNLYSDLLEDVRNRCKRTVERAQGASSQG